MSETKNPSTPDGADSSNPTHGSTADGVSDEWVDRLRSDGEVRDQAITELREVLVRGLSRSMANRYGGSVQAEDVVQEALIKILDSLDQFAGRSRFTTWALTIANRIAISQMRRKYFQDVSIESFAREDAPALQIADQSTEKAGATMDRRAMVGQLQSLIDQTLTEKQQFAIRAILEGMPVEVIAEKSGGNRNSVYKLIHDARTKLRAGLEAAGFAAGDLAETFS